MSSTEYLPVNKLLTLGDVRGIREWLDYRTFGLGPEHIPDLIRMGTDEALNAGNPESVEVWAPVHAWRALGQLRAEAAIEPLLGLLCRIDEAQDDYAAEDLPQVFGMIGPAALPLLDQYLGNPSHGLYARVAAAGGIARVGQRHPETRTECVTTLSGSLGQYDANDPVLNAFVISALLDLKAIEAAPAIERAFAAGRVDHMVVGDWENAQVELGLKSVRDVPLLASPVQSVLPPGLHGIVGSRAESSKAMHQKEETKAKRKRKMAKASRKKNRQQSR